LIFNFSVIFDLFDKLISHIHLCHRLFEAFLSAVMAYEIVIGSQENLISSNFQNNYDDPFYLLAFNRPGMQLTINDSIEVISSIGVE